MSAHAFNRPWRGRAKWDRRRCMTCKARMSAAPRRRKNINVIRVIIGSTTLELATTGGFRLSHVGFLRGPSNGLDSPTEITLSMRSSCLRSYLARDYISSQIWISLTKPIRVLSPNRGFPYRLSSPSSCKVVDLAEEGRTPGHFIPARLRLPGVKRNGRGPATPSVHQPSLPLSSLYIYLVADDRRDLLSAGDFVCLPSLLGAAKPTIALILFSLICCLRCPAHRSKFSRDASRPLAKPMQRSTCTKSDSGPA